MLNAIITLGNRIKEAVENFFIGRLLALYSPFRVRTS